MIKYKHNHACGHLLVCLLLLGAGIHGNDDPTDDNSSADAADPLSTSAPSFTPTATSPYAATGNTNTDTHGHLASHHTQNLKQYLWMSGLLRHDMPTQTTQKLHFSKPIGTRFIG